MHKSGSSFHFKASETVITAESQILIFGLTLVRTSFPGMPGHLDRCEKRENLALSILVYEEIKAKF